MAYDGWVALGGTEIINLHRTSVLSESLGLPSMWKSSGAFSWIGEALGMDATYGDITQAPWYDADIPASAEFAGVIPLSISGLDDSTLSASTSENVTDGGNTAKGRSASLSMVVSACLTGSTERGVSYGRDWLATVLSAPSQSPAYCAGAELRYFPERNVDSVLGVKHRREVRVTRGLSITKKRELPCEHLWYLTFTLTADDPFEYGESLFGTDIVLVSDPTDVYPNPGGFMVSRGTEAMTQQTCPVYDYSPMQDPDRPSLTAPPSPPDMYPDGWAIENGATFTRYWARVKVHGSWVPWIRFVAPEIMRNVRVSVWPSNSDVTDQCDPLFSVILTYVPSFGGTDGFSIYVDGERQAVYAWNGLDEAPLRRAESFAFSEDASPVEWARVTKESQVLVTVDVFDPPVGTSSVTPLVGFHAIPKSF